MNDIEIESLEGGKFRFVCGDRRAKAQLSIKGVIECREASTGKWIKITTNEVGDLVEVQDLLSGVERTKDNS